MQSVFEDSFLTSKPGISFESASNSLWAPSLEKLYHRAPKEVSCGVLARPIQKIAFLFCCPGQ